MTSEADRIEVTSTVTWKECLRGVLALTHRLDGKYFCLADVDKLEIAARRIKDKLQGENK